MAANTVGQLGKTESESNTANLCTPPMQRCALHPRTSLVLQSSAVSFTWLVLIEVKLAFSALRLCFTTHSPLKALAKLDLNKQMP